MNVHLRGAFLMTRAVQGHMTEANGDGSSTSRRPPRSATAARPTTPPPRPACRASPRPSPSSSAGSASRQRRRARLHRHRHDTRQPPSASAWRSRSSGRRRRRSRSAGSASPRTSPTRSRSSARRGRLRLRPGPVRRRRTAQLTLRLAFTGSEQGRDRDRWAAARVEQRGSLRGHLRLTSSARGEGLGCERSGTSPGRRGDTRSVTWPLRTRAGRGQGARQALRREPGRHEEATRLARVEHAAPASLWGTTRGCGMLDPSQPRRFFVSPGFTPESRTRHRTSPGPGSGAARSPTSITSAARGSYQTARIPVPHLWLTR